MIHLVAIYFEVFESPIWLSSLLNVNYSCLSWKMPDDDIVNCCYRTTALDWHSCIWDVCAICSDVIGRLPPPTVSVMLCILLSFCLTCLAFASLRNAGVKNTHLSWKKKEKRAAVCEACVGFCGALPHFNALNSISSNKPHLHWWYGWINIVW